MQDLQTQLKNTGLSVTVRVVESGQLFSLNFPKGEDAKLVHVALGPLQATGYLKLVPVTGVQVEQPNMTLILELPLASANAAVKLEEKMVVTAKTEPDQTARVLELETEVAELKAQVLKVQVPDQTARVLELEAEVAGLKAQVLEAPAPAPLVAEVKKIDLDAPPEVSIPVEVPVTENIPATPPLSQQSNKRRR